MKIETRKIDELKAYENNPRKNDKAVNTVANSIREFGFKVPIVIDKNGTVVAGHTRLKACVLLGIEEVMCVVADDLTPEQIKAFRLADNKTAELAEWDYKLLDAELAELTGFDMSEFGFEMDEKLQLQDDDFDLDKNLNSIDMPICQLGDIWQLGRHRLICGDSTDSDVISALMDGVRADLLLTDPPYNVKYMGKTDRKLMIQNDNIPEDQFQEFLIKAFCVADNVMKCGAAFYIWHPDGGGLPFRMACIETGWEIRQCIIWAKNSFTLCRQDYQWQHEPCLYGWKSGAAHYFVGDRTQSTVWSYNRPLRNGEHPTMKPIELMGRAVSNSTNKNGVVLDLFGGSGSTLIACEQLGRSCYMAELDRRYCDVILKRWESVSNEKAVLLKNVLADKT